MASRVARRRARRKPAKVVAERRRAAQRQVRSRLQELISGTVRLAVEAALLAEVSTLVGREKYQRRDLTDGRVTRAKCSRCPVSWRSGFWRAGSYQRTLLTVVAVVVLRVPRVGCVCGGSVPLEFEAVGRYERSWGDVQERARELAGLCLSLEASRAVLAWEHGQVLAKSTLHGWVEQAAGLAEALRVGPLARVPAVVLLDGIWVRLLEASGAGFIDQRGRQRQRLRRVKAVVLVAYGVDPASGEHWVLDGERAGAEDQASWQRLVERLQARGLQTATGLELIVHDGSSGLEAALDQVHLGPGLLRQRCVFHVLKNVRDAVRGEPGMSREAKRERRRDVLRAAAAIWQTTDRPAVYQRWAAFQAEWSAREPEVVATVERVFPATLAYLAALERGRERGQVWSARYLRTTSLLERFNRALRQKVRQVGAFKAERGLRAALALVIVHAGRLEAQPGALWAEVLEAGLLAA